MDAVTSALASASTRQTQLFGPRPSGRIERIKGRASPKHRQQSLSVQYAGFSLNAVVYIPSDEPEALERLCRYIMRPAIAQERLQLLSGDRVALTLRRPWQDGTTQLIFDPLDFIARVAALIPAPRTHLVRYHGVFAPASRRPPPHPQPQRALLGLLSARPSDQLLNAPPAPGPPLLLSGGPCASLGSSARRSPRS